MCCWRLAALLIAVAFAAPALRGIQRSLLLGLGTRLQFLFLAVALSALVTDVLKWCVGRGRPFVGGEANPFNFSHFAGTPAYCQLSVRPRHDRLCAGLRGVARCGRRRGWRWPSMPLIIAASRLVLLAHHPSDVVAGALVGIIGAMFVRYWFAARRLGFAIQRDGTIVSLAGPSSGRLKRVARGASAP